MARRFVSLEDAAQMLGITKERLNELREAGKAHGYRDGAGWKFKEEEIERLQSEGIPADEPDDDELSLDDDDISFAGPEQSDSVLLSDVELGESEETSGSTVIGRADALPEMPVDEDSDLKLEGSAGEGGSEIELEMPGIDDDGEIELARESDVSLASDVRLVGGASDVLSRESGGSDLLSSDDDEVGAGSGAFDDLDDIELEIDGPAGATSSVIADESGVISADDSGLSLSMEDAPGASSLDLDDDDDDGALVLGEGSGSDITLSSGDSGISLVDPADSGLALDSEPLDLGGSTVGSLSLDQQEETFELEQLSSPNMAGAGLKADDDFMLTPETDQTEEESEDSGSQVIALDSSDLDMADSGAPVAEEDLGEAMLEEDLTAPPSGARAPEKLAAGAPAPAAATDGTYSVWNILSLTLCVLLLTIGGMMMVDLMRNMWSWNETYSVNSALMDGILGALGLS